MWRFGDCDLGMGGGDSGEETVKVVRGQGSDWARPKGSLRANMEG